MNFNLAPITRIISTVAKDETSYAAPPTFTAGGALAAGAVPLKSGRGVTVFFEVPSCPIAANQIDIKLHEVTAGTCLGIRALPNVYLTDADSYLFIRGNSVVANNATATDGIHVVYSAIVEGVLPASRSGDSSGAWVRPGDVLVITPPTTAHTSNATQVSSVDAEVINVRQRNNNTFLIDFTVGIDPDLVTSGISGWAKNELLFHTGTTASPTALLGLARDQLSLNVSASPKGGGNVQWKGILKSAVNLSYPSANKSGIIPAMNASDFLLAPKSYIASCGIPSIGTGSSLQNLKIYADPDYNSGAMPFKCLSIVDNSSNASSYYNLEISIIPMY